MRNDDRLHPFVGCMEDDMKKLMQIHHQFRDGRTDMVRQLECESLDELAAACRECAETHPLPKGAQWLFCEEGAKQFVYADAPNMD